MPKSVTVYSTQTCGYCKAAKEWFDEKSVAYEDIDVGTNKEKAQEMIEKSGQMGVPVFAIKDENGQEEILIGFDRNRLSATLGLSAD